METDQQSLPHRAVFPQESRRLVKLLSCKVPSCSKSLVLMFPDDDPEAPEDMEEEIPVVICAAAGRMGAAMAAINSIYSNTDANVMFYVVGLRSTLPRIR